MLKKVSEKSKRGQFEIVLHNDNHNSFDHVITCLMEICGHNELQAYQCALIVDSIGACSICTDTYDECLKMDMFLKKSRLKTTLKKYKKT